jgi:hypothetical protein
MRENRLSGSEGGGTEINRPSLPLSPAGSLMDFPGMSGHVCKREQMGAPPIPSRPGLSTLSPGRPCPQIGCPALARRASNLVTARKRPPIALITDRDKANRITQNLEAGRVAREAGGQAENRLDLPGRFRIRALLVAVAGCGSPSKPWSRDIAPRSGRTIPNHHVAPLILSVKTPEPPGKYQAGPGGVSPADPQPSSPREAIIPSLDHPPRLFSRLSRSRSNCSIAFRFFFGSSKRYSS